MKNDAPDAYQLAPLNLAIVGRPNVGKSSLLNRLLGEERAIVSPLAGTTRDSVDTFLKTPEHTFRIIDTAGIRRKGKTTAMAEKLSVLMARKSLERADVAIVVLDAEQGVAALDVAIAGYAVEAGCSIILAVNKWDAVENKLTGTAAAFERGLRDQMKFLSWAAVVTISALKGQRVQKLLLCAAGGFQVYALPGFVLALLRHVADDVQIVISRAAAKMVSTYALEVASRESPVAS